MDFNNITQRIGFFISKEILKTPADVTDAIKELSDYSFLPSAETDDDDENQSLRLELTTKDKKHIVIVQGKNINVIRNKMADEDILDSIQQHLDTASGIMEKLKVKFGFEVANVAVECDYLTEATEFASKTLYKKYMSDDDIPVAWRFNRLYKRTAGVANEIICMEHESCMRDDVQLRYEDKPTDRLIMELSWGTVFEKTPTEELISASFRYFFEQTTAKIQLYNGL